MDKNTLTGLVLIGLLLFGFSWFSKPSEMELQQRAMQDSIATAQQMQAAKQEIAQKETAKATWAADSNATFFEQRSGKEQEITIKNNKVKITLNTHGGTIQHAEVLGYKSRQVDGDVILFNKENAHMSISFAGKQENILTEDYYFSPIEQTENSVTMMLGTPDKNIQMRYTLHEDSYLMDFDIVANGMAGFFAPDMKKVNINWADRIYQQEKGQDFENRYSSLTYKKARKGVDNLSETSDETKSIEESLDWIAFKNQFFSAVLISQTDFTNAELKCTQEKEKNTGFLKTYEAEMKTAFDPTGKIPTHMEMYLGPNDFHTLQLHNEISSTNKDLELENLVYLGWWLFRWINRWSILYIFDWLSAMGLPMGIVLLLLTIIVKIAVWPSQKKSYLSSAKMRVLKPQVDALAAKYPHQEDAMKKQQEMMQIYSQYGVSPMGGCLPMLIQMPIWLALFNFVPNAIELRGESFLWAEDLSAYDDIIRWGTDLWLIGDHLSIFCILFCATNIVNTWISMKQQQTQFSGEQAQQMKMMQYMMYVMPIMFFFMFNNYSSGLTYYYFISGLVNILTMWYLRKSTDDAKLLAKLEEYKAKHKNDPKKTSGLAARLEALQKMQEEQMKNRK